MRNLGLVVLIVFFQRLALAVHGCDSTGQHVDLGLDALVP
jgi:hypothetical protein